MVGGVRERPLRFRGWWQYCGYGCDWIKDHARSFRCHHTAANPETAILTIWPPPPKMVGGVRERPVRILIRVAFLFPDPGDWRYFHGAGCLLDNLRRRSQDSKNPPAAI